MSMARRCAALGLFLLASPTASAQEASKCLRDGCGVAAPGGSEEQALLQLRQEEKQCAGGGSPYHDNARRKRLKKIWRGKRCPFGNGHPDLEPEEEKKCVDMKQLKEVAQGMIELMMESMQDPGPPAEWPAVCEMSNKEKCPLSKMGGKRHMIKPGGKTTCLDSEYAFLVEPGDSDKLLIYFQGGGLCLNALTYTLGTCNKDLHGAYDFSGPGHHMGFFNRSNPHDPLRNHTSITLHYCSGDMHLGDKEHHTWSKNGTVKQAGFLNAMAGIRWALDNMPNKLSSLVISGESAGAIGTQVWADYLLSNRMLFTLGKKFNYHHAAVIVDSGVGVLPEGAIDMTLGMYGTCNLPVLSHPHQMACSHGTLSNNHVIMDAMARLRACSSGSSSLRPTSSSAHSGTCCTSSPIRRSSSSALTCSTRRRCSGSRTMPRCSRTSRSCWSLGARTPSSTRPTSTRPAPWASWLARRRSIRRCGSGSPTSSSVSTHRGCATAKTALPH
mmetsp:Transcript_76163/g.196234  ORF Transcript_76163/g.196234 Transcript_76163/m.196234 type:complete len:498 (+) Transcript_76163:90-1583(+)